MSWKTGWFNTVLLLVLISASSSINAEEKHQIQCDRQDVIPLGLGVEGRATICNGHNRIYARLRARGLVPGDAYTVWWVYIDNPDFCIVPGQCTPEDFAGENPIPVFGRMDSLVAGAHGRGWFSDFLRGLTPSTGSQIWLLVFGHGEADKFDTRHRARQILTPEDPSAGTPHLGNVVDGALGFPAALVVFDF